MSQKPWGLMTPESVGKILVSLHHPATLDKEAALYLAEIFNVHIEKTLRSAYRCAIGRASTVQQDTEMVKTNYTTHIPTTQFLSALDLGNVELTAADFDRYVNLPSDYQAALSTSEHPSLFGPIKSFTS